MTQVFNELFSFEYLYTRPTVNSAEKMLHFMMQSGQYMAHGSWLCGSYSSGLKRTRTEAYWRMLHDPAFCSADDVALVFFDQDRTGRYTTIVDTIGDDECDLVDETLDECKERAKRLKTQFDAEEADLAVRQEQATRVPTMTRDEATPADPANEPGPHHQPTNETGEEDDDDEENEADQPRPSKRRTCRFLDDEAQDGTDDEDKGGIPQA